MKILFFFLLSLHFCPLCFGQTITDTIYYDNDNEICIKDSAYYYRVSQKEDSSFLITEYYTNGVTRTIGYSSTYGDSLIYSGEYKSFFKNGALLVKANYYNGKLQGKCIRYLEDGTIYCTGQFISGIPEGEFYYYFPNHKVRRYENYADKKLIAKKCYTETGQDTAYYPSIKPPVLKGKYTKEQFIQRHVIYPPEAEKNGITGIVKVYYTINKDGSLSNVRTKYEGNELLKKEALKVVSKMKKWTPGSDDTGYIKFRWSTKVTFRLQ